MSQIGQNRKSSMRANVFRFARESGHCAIRSACPFGAEADIPRDIATKKKPPEGGIVCGHDQRHFC
jgi:hypothetical protein